MALKVRDLAYGRLRSPDLDAEEEFLTAFGMVRVAAAAFAAHPAKCARAPHECRAPMSS